ncbi:hypothetical protein ASG40_07995 [Methylobacterium sp. Leaf399]|uniref:hypothetical protein n=1 Tax=unclassified Methylobacterium TaxID=2615210 RepID=UPI0006F7BF5F|nr:MULTISPECIES: hypothetical protein [unclassified Methylobacterium]KQP52747.1 hypothetical protein ASF39_07620 [Methylobacterium sp. Leaf108]KQT11926.1 hypothetical protein ASG40_07995 [Methylobacterium sp. Leaf399]KQT84466.1 hypothetical protein ASG59_03605 [Methylobacterium sp. Leaf466]
MALILTLLWPAVLAALALGVLVGALTGLPRERGAGLAAAGLALGAAVLTGLALVGPVAGRPGFWIEIVALCLDAYLAGCLVGGAVAFVRRPRAQAGAVARR